MSDCIGVGAGGHWAMRNFRRPSPAAVLAFIALMVALGGTALAATGQLVNITDPTNAANKAAVDAGGALKTTVSSGYVAALPSRSPFFNEAFLSGGGVLNTLIPANNATVALTRA